MNTSTTFDDQADQIAQRVSVRLWRSLVLPSLGLQLAMLVAMCVVAAAPVHSAWADDDDEPVMAQLPDEGQPPAPSLAAPIAVEPVAVEPVAVEPVAVEPVAVEPAAVEPAAVEPAAPAATPEERSETTIPEPAAKVTDEPVAEVVSTEQLGAAATAPSKQSDPEKVRELSVEPASEAKPLLPPDHPAWVAAPPDTSTSVHRLFVGSFITNTAEEALADEAIDDPLIAAVRRYLGDIALPGQSADQMPITAEFIRTNLLDTSTNYLARMNSQSNTVYQNWVILRITPEQREYFADQLQLFKQRERLSILGLGVAGLLALTGLANVAFNRRRRRYNNPLQIGTPPMVTAPPAAMAMDNRQLNPLVQLAGTGQPAAKTSKGCWTKRGCKSKAFWFLMAGLAVLAVFKARREHSESPRVIIHNQSFDVSPRGLIHSFYTSDADEHESSEHDSSDVN